MGWKYDTYYTYFDRNTELDYGWLPSGNSCDPLTIDYSPGSGTFLHRVNRANPMWECRYCRRLNFVDTIECVGCGAGRMI